MHCVSCRKEVLDPDQRFCGACGAPMPRKKPPAPKTSLKPLLVFFFVILGAAALFVIANLSSSSSADSGNEPQKGSLQSDPMNVSNSSILSLAPSLQTVALSKAVEAGCVGDRSFYMGDDRSNGYAFWSLACSDGREFLVELLPDREGTTKVLDCPTAKLTAGVTCFKQLDKRD